MASFGVGSIIAKVEADITDFATKMNSVSDMLEDIRENGFQNNTVLGMLGGAFTAVGVAGATAMKKVTDAASEFNDTFDYLKLATGAEGDRIKEVGENTRKLFRDGLGSAYDEIAGPLAFADAHLTGTNEKIERMTEKALQLKNSLGLDPNNVLFAISRGEYYMNAEGDSIYDVLLAMYQQTGENENEITALLSEFAPDFDILGYSIQDLGDKVIYGMDNGSKSVGEIMSIYRNFRMNVQNMNDDFVRGLLTLHYDPNEVLKNISQGGEVAKKQVDDIINTLGSLEDDTLRRRLMSSMFGATEEGIGSDFFRNYADSSNVVPYDGRFEKFISDFEDENIAHNMRELKNAISDLMTSIGSEYLPVLIALTNTLTDFVNLIGDLHREYPVLSKITAGLLAIVTGVGLIGGAIFFGAMAWNMLGGVIKNTFKTIKGMSSWLKPFVQTVRGWFTRLLGGLKILRFAIHPIVLLIIAGITLVKTLYNILKNNFGKEFADLYLNVLFPFLMLQDLLELIQSFFIKILPEGVRHFAEVVFNVMNGVLRALTMPFQMFYNFMKGETLNPFKIIAGTGNQTLNFYPQNMDQTNAGSVGRQAARELRGQSNGLIT